MGFHAYMKGRLERITDKGIRKIRAEVFDSVLNKWIVQDFPGYDPTAALAWIAERMNQVDM